MLPLRAHRRPLAWVTLIALLLAALATGLSRAMAQQRGDIAPWSVVCAAAGDSTAPTAPGDAARHLLEHCPLCAWQADSLGLPPASPSLATPLALGQAVPALLLHAPRPLPAWSAAQARAPPQSV